MCLCFVPLHYYVEQLYYSGFSGLLRSHHVDLRKHNMVPKFRYVFDDSAIVWGILQSRSACSMYLSCLCFRRRMCMRLKVLVYVDVEVC